MDLTTTLWHLAASIPAARWTASSESSSPVLVWQANKSSKSRMADFFLSVVKIKKSCLWEDFWEAGVACEVNRTVWFHPEFHLADRHGFSFRMMAFAVVCPNCSKCDSFPLWLQGPESILGYLVGWWYGISTMAAVVHREILELFQEWADNRWRWGD